MGEFHRRTLADLGYDVATCDPRPGVADHIRPPHRDFETVAIAAPAQHLAECAFDWSGHTGWLLVEKPGAVSAAEARNLERLLSGQKVAVGYIERFNPRLRDLNGSEPPGSATFYRWNTRQSEDPALDLQSHDIDLARFLGVERPMFDTRAGSPNLRREIVGWGKPVDLLAHTTSPLHAQWHAFLSGRPDNATLADAACVLEQLGR